MVGIPCKVTAASHASASIDSESRLAVDLGDMNRFAADAQKMARTIRLGGEHNATGKPSDPDVVRSSYRQTRSVNAA
jgi:hypothetical protein